MLVNHIEENFKKVFEFSDPKKVEQLSYQEIMSLKDAIRRDVDAIEFVLELSREHEGSKKTLDKIKSGEKARL